jgi:hypothetical protein
MWVMARKVLVAGWLSAACLAASVASADPGMKIAPASGPPNVDARVRVVLHDAVEKELSGNDSVSVLGAYTLFPKLVELRRYVEGEQKTPTSVCIVELTLVDGSGAVAARVRTAADSPTATQREVLEAAAQAATARISVSLAAFSRAERDRVARR